MGNISSFFFVIKNVLAPIRGKAKPIITYSLDMHVFELCITMISRFLFALTTFRWFLVAAFVSQML